MQIFTDPFFIGVLALIISLYFFIRNFWVLKVRNYWNRTIHPKEYRNLPSYEQMLYVKFWIWNPSKFLKQPN